MLGVINLDKPVGPTSHDMVGLLRRLTATRRIGHAGTLDPLASGVLPILVGAATRFSEELTGGRKRYEAVVRLGQRSATDDAQGPITAVPAPLPSDAAIVEALAGFVGTHDQRPPAFSARKQGGRTAHRAARAGEPLELASRPVTVDALDLLDLTRAEGIVDVRIDLRCGPGTYVRSIARDLGDRLGCGGHLHALRRTEAAGLGIETAVTPAELEAAAERGELAIALIPIGDLLPLPALSVGSDAAWRFVHGSAQAAPAGAASGRVKVYDADGQLLGIGLASDGELRPAKVLAPDPAA
ncbi:MAG TPA: tRNA pseudouridine(55) synthase TruB [Candidatus Limnocylindria bacterium]|jgi:tRNA pseudouridine55 synthase